LKRGTKRKGKSDQRMWKGKKNDAMMGGIQRRYKDNDFNREGIVNNGRTARLFKTLGLFPPEREELEGDKPSTGSSLYYEGPLNR